MQATTNIVVRLFLTAMEDCIRNYLSTRFLIDLTLEKLRCKPLEETQGQILAHVFHPFFFANTDTPATCILVALDGNIYHANVLHL